MGQTGRRDSVGFLPRPHRSYRRVHQACHFSSTPDFVEYVSNVDCHNRMYANIARYFQAERCDMSNKLQQGTTSAGVFSVCPDRRFALSEGMDRGYRSEEHTSELQSLMRISYAVFCLKKKTPEIPNLEIT